MDEIYKLKLYTLSKGYNNDVMNVELQVIYFQIIDCISNGSNHLSKISKYGIDSMATRMLRNFCSRLQLPNSANFTFITYLYMLWELRNAKIKPEFYKIQMIIQYILSHSSLYLQPFSPSKLYKVYSYFDFRLQKILFLLCQLQFVN